MDRVFLDANVLFSAAYRPGSGLARLWEVEGIRLLTSAYAMDEVGRNLPDARQLSRLEQLAQSLEVSSALATPALLADVVLPNKDRPIMLAAIQAKATHLLTGDVTHFGPYFGQTIGGVLILTPAAYLHDKRL